MRRQQRVQWNQEEEVQQQHCPIWSAFLKSPSVASCERQGLPHSDATLSPHLFLSRLRSHSDVHMVMVRYALALKSPLVSMQLTMSSGRSHQDYVHRLQPVSSPAASTQFPLSFMRCPPHSPCFFQAKHLQLRAGSFISRIPRMRRSRFCCCTCRCFRWSFGQRGFFQAQALADGRRARAIGICGPS